MNLYNSIISDKRVACNGALIAVAAVFAYSIIVMIYIIIRSSATIYGIMPAGDRNSILLTNGFSIAYSIVVVSLIMAGFSSLAGFTGAIVLKKSLSYFNPQFNSGKAVLISCITASLLLVIIYLILFSLLKDWMTVNYPEPLSFWFLFPAFICFGVCIIGGSKLNKHLAREIIKTNTPSKNNIVKYILP